MPYRLGIDLGTTFTAAAICRQTPDRTVHTELVPLGTRSVAVPSVLYVNGDTLVVGEAADRRAVTDPGLVAREFKRRIGDEVPILLGDAPHAAEDLAARLLHWVVDRVVEREGEDPEAIAVTHPASWGSHRVALLREALDLDDVVLLTEPQAAAMHYASAERVEPGTTIAVYDLGGGTFDAAVVHKTEGGGFDLLGSPEGLDHLGGIDFDDAIVDHVLNSVPAHDDPLAMARLRRECTEAKEALSTDSEVVIAVLLPGSTSQVRLTRAQFETLIRPVLADTVDALALAVASAGLRQDEVDAVLLVGGSSRIPLAARLISERLGRPVAVDADPKGVVALGAALAAHRSLTTDITSAIPVPRRPDHDCDPPALARPRRRLRRTKTVLSTFVMLLLALAVIPSPFTADTPPPSRNGSTAAQPGQPGAQPNKPTQPGTTRKRPAPGQPSQAHETTGTRDVAEPTQDPTTVPPSPPASTTSAPAQPRSEPTPDTVTQDTPPATAGSATAEGVPTVAAEPPPAEPPADTPPPAAPPEEAPPPPAPAEPDPVTEAPSPPPAPEPSPGE